MNLLRKKYRTYLVICFALLLLTCLLTFPPIRTKIPIYAISEIVDWYNMLIVPIVLSFLTGLFVSVWFTYLNEKEKLLRGINEEFILLKQLVMKNESDFYTIFYSQGYSFTNKMQQISNRFNTTPVINYLYIEYPELENSVNEYYKKLKSCLVKPLYEVDHNSCTETKNNDYKKIVTSLGTITCEALAPLNEQHKKFKANYFDKCK